MTPAKSVQVLRARTDPRSSKHLPVFVTARSLLGLASGVPSVDSLIGGLKPGTVALLTGSEIRLQAAEGYCVRAQLPESRGGLDGGAYFIDGGNSFDVYLLTALARRHHIGYDDALERQLIARAFTVYELCSLVRDSPVVFARYKPKLLVISEVFSTFNQDVKKTEACRLMRDIVDALSQLNANEGVPVLITAATRPEALTRILEERCTISADVDQRDHRERVRLFKHPWKAPMEAVRQEAPRTYNQDTLTRWSAG